MRSRPVFLDAFCGAGGCTKGYQRAGAYVVGVDLHPQPNYCGDEFIQCDALKFLEGLIAWGGSPGVTGSHRARPWYRLEDFDAIHASPPCQEFTAMSNRWRGHGGKADQHLNLIPDTRRLLEQTGLPYVIENVSGARSHLREPVVLNGGMFGLRVDRPRLFETNWPLLVPERVPVDNPIGVYGKAHDGRLLFARRDGTEQRCAASLEEGQAAMGIDWMPWPQLTQAIPPAYCELIGLQLATFIQNRAAA